MAAEDILRRLDVSLEEADKACFDNACRRAVTLAQQKRITLRNIICTLLNPLNVLSHLTHAATFMNLASYLDLCEDQKNHQTAIREYLAWHNDDLVVRSKAMEAGVNYRDMDPDLLVRKRREHCMTQRIPIPIHGDAGCHTEGSSEQSRAMQEAHRTTLQRMGINFPV